MNYKLITDPDNEFRVVETTTHQTVKAFGSQKEAKAFLRHLNMGGGFDGWTPLFMLKQIDLTKINFQYSE